MEEFLNAIFLNERNALAKVKIAKIIIKALQKNMLTKTELINILKENGFYKRKTFLKTLKKLKAFGIIRIAKIENKKYYVLSPDGFYFFFKSFYNTLKL